ncbi:hypothetical protein SRHO_G00213090 [Serrasalmus rhombeus]
MGVFQYAQFPSTTLDCFPSVRVRRTQVRQWERDQPKNEAFERRRCLIGRTCVTCFASNSHFFETQTTGGAKSRAHGEFSDSENERRNRRSARCRTDTERVQRTRTNRVKVTGMLKSANQAHLSTPIQHHCVSVPRRPVLFSPSVWTRNF